MLNALLNWLSGGREREYGSVWFEFNTPFGIPTAIVILAVVFCGGALYWWLRLERVSGRWRWGLAGLRAGALTLVLFMLLDPALVGRRNEPGKQFVLVLVDDSRSMGVSGGDGKTRGERFLDAYGASGFEEALRKSHQVALFRFGAHPERLRDTAELRFDQRESDIVGAVEAALRKMVGTTVSAVVLFSDGVQQSRGPFTEIESLPDDVPVFTVGTGLEARWRSLELAGISVARTNFDRSPVALTARVASDGLAGEEVVVEVIEGARVVAITLFTVADDRDEQSVRLEFVPKKEGWLRYRARVRLAETGASREGVAVEAITHPEKDRIAENNVRAFVMDNRDRTYRILYFSGRPTWEHKFVRRALEEDPQLELSSLIRISGAERKFVFRGRDASMSNPLFEGFDDTAANAPRYDEAVFIRIGVRESELASGYPLEAEDLYRYDLVIWADIERDFFSQGHLELTRDFVSKRGGSLLMGGGPRSFAEGKYGNTVIEAMLPVVLAAPEGGDNSELMFKPDPTIEGMLSGIWALDSDPERDGAIWDGLPELFGVNRFVMTRAGATVLARVKGTSGKFEGQPLFAWQRYGEGTCAVLATGETWQWQMLTENGDDTHERFWRQVVRGLVKDVQAPISLVSGGEELTVGDTRRLAFLVRDSLFTAREGLATEVRLTDPDGNDLHLPVEESISEAGMYSVEFDPERAGMHLAHLSARDAQGNVVGSLEEAVMVHSDHREFQNARYNPSFLKAIAAHSGGAFTTLEELDELAAKIPWTDNESEHLDRFHLWHFPPFYFAVVILLAVEWYLRRTKGQP